MASLKQPIIKAEKVDFKKMGVKAVLIAFVQNKLDLSSAVKRVDSEADGLISACIKNKDFRGEKGDVKSLYSAKNGLQIVLLGLGEDNKLTLETICSYAASALRALRDKGVDKIGMLLDSFVSSKFDDELIAEKITASALMGLFRFDDYRTKEIDKLKYVNEIKLLTFSDNIKKYSVFVEKGIVVGNAVNKTRALINTPPNVANPEYVAGYCKEIAKSAGLKCTIIEEEQAKKLGMNCFLAVGKGSANKPKFVVLEYNHGGSSSPIVLVGKGITFDSGGLNVKVHPYMQNMKDDKAGAVSVVHVIEACALLGLRLNVVAVTPLCENMPSGTSYRPDDVIKSYSGITVEVRNTDAEGRMVLADALAYSLRYKPKAMISVATLTGATKVVLGETGTPIMGNNPELISKIKYASNKAMEKVWELPLWEEYDEELKSDIADVKHLSDEGNAGTIIGAVFLKNFIGNTPWAHFDIATTSLLKADKGVNPKGATGVSVRLLIELLRGWK